MTRGALGGPAKTFIVLPLQSGQNSTLFFCKRSNLGPVVWGPSRTHRMKWVRTGSQEEHRIISQLGHLPTPMSRPHHEWPARAGDVLMTDAQLQGLWFWTTPYPHHKPRRFARQAANNSLDILLSKITECSMTDEGGILGELLTRARGSHITEQPSGCAHSLIPVTQVKPDEALFLNQVADTPWPHLSCGRAWVFCWNNNHLHEKKNPTWTSVRSSWNY